MSDPVETIHRAVEFIEAHLQCETSVDQIAAAVGYSLFHFVRTFDRIVQHTPYDYLMRRRLSEAARALSSSDRRIIDIAQDFCFKNHETFSRAFKRMFGVQPNQWRDKAREYIGLLMPDLTYDDLRFINQNSFKSPIIAEYEDTTLCGLMTSLTDGENTYQEQRKRLCADVFGLLGDAPPGRLFGITHFLDENRHASYYRLGVKKADLRVVPPAFVEYTLPAGRYVCIDAIEEDAVPAIKYLLHTWFPRNRLWAGKDLQIEFFTSAMNEGDPKTICIPLQLDPLAGTK